eukprot:TRINITY_DN4424_c0_g1_i1.p1 TRINITY_DN4424_c0_g1~~TRINITY_DN4424_c0_g1_i1.p1  ORF type:complete len:123 (+),score=8.33 TRINITY_DN4424_c0_g1_i1:313-681(+)
MSYEIGGKYLSMTFILATLTGIAMAVEANAGLPMEIGPQLPIGYSVVANVHIQAGQPLRKFEIVALVSKDEIHLLRSPKPAPPRPLLVFEQKDGHFVLSGRNEIGRAVQQECRDRSRMPSSA